MVTITTKEFGFTKEGKKVTAYELVGEGGAMLRLLDFGATIQSMFVPDRNGKLVDVVMGYDDLASYEIGSCYYGAVVGRYANRIKDARFVLDGVTYQLEKNSENGFHHLHGVYAKRVFEGSIIGESVVFHYLSPDGEEGYPGNLDLTVKYTLTKDNALEIEYEAKTDATTVVNLTNHCYFNLNGQDGSTIFDHKVYLNAIAYTEYTPTFAPTGNIIPVDGTPLDFRTEHTIGEHFNDDYEQLRICTGYDHNMVLAGKEGEFKMIGTARSEKTGIMLEAYTTEPAIQFYTSNYGHLDQAKCGKNGIRYPKQGAFCFEAQHYPDSINRDNFPSAILRPGKPYTQRTVYRFKVC